MESAFRRWWGAAAWFGVAALGVLLLLVGVLFSYHFFQDPCSFNSDDLYCSALCEDVLHGRDLRGWHMPAAPYPFPDVLLLLPCHALTSNVGAAFVAYAAVFYLLLVIVLAWVVRQAGRSWRASLAVGAAGVLFLLGTHLRPGYGGRAQLLFHAGNHVGAVFTGLLLTGCVLRCLRHGCRWPAVGTLVVAGTLGGFSDKLLIVQFVAPLLLALGVLAALRLAPGRRIASVVGLLALATVLAFQVKFIFARYGIQLLRAEGDFHLFAPFDPGKFFQHVLDCMRDQPITRAALEVHLVLGLLLVLAWTIRPRVEEDAARGPEGDRPAALFVALALWASPLCNLGAIVCTGMTENPAIDRYLHGCFVLPYLAAGVWLSLAPWRPLRAGAVLGHLAIASFAVFLIVEYLPALDWDRFAPRYPPIAQALDDLVRRHGPLRGIAGFWQARELSFLTKEHVHLRSVNQVGGAYPHAGNLQAYLSADPHDTSVPDYHFVLISPEDSKLMPTPEAILCEYGEPVEQIQVGNCSIWRYHRLEGRRWEIFLRARLALRLRQEWEYVTPQEPKTLQKPKQNLSRWDHSGNVKVLRGRSLEVRFGRPVTGRLLDVGANWADQFRLAFYRGDEEVATVRVPAVGWPGATYGPAGMQSRLVPLPAACGEKGWDRVVMTPVICHECASVGHFLVYQQELPYRLVHALAPGQQRRYEGEILPALEQPALRVVPDPTASGGRVRQAAPGYAGLVTSGPFVFLPPGHYRVDFTLAVGETAPGNVATIAVAADSGLMPLRSRELQGNDFPGPGRFARHSFHLEVADELDNVEFRVCSTGKTTVSLDCIDLTRLVPESLPQPAPVEAAEGNR